MEASAAEASLRVSIRFVRIMPVRRFGWLGVVAIVSSTFVVTAQQTGALPATPLHYGFFTLTFSSDGSVSLRGDGWPAFSGFSYESSFKAPS